MFKTILLACAIVGCMQINSMRPRLIVPDPDESIDYYRAAFDAELEERYVTDERIVVHAALMIQGWTFSVAAEVPEWGLLAPTTLGGSPMLITLDVDDARAVADRMVGRGGRVLVPVEDRPYGRCEGRIQDPFGHLWIPSHEVTPPPPQEGLDPQSRLTIRRIVADLTVTDTTVSAQFFRRLLGLEPVMDLGWVATLTPETQPNRQLTLMTDDATATLNPHVSIEVDNLDVVWRRAVEIDADIAYERTLEPWGVERFFVRDESGNVINILSHVDPSANGT